MQTSSSIPKLSASLLLIKENMKILFMLRPSTGSFANMWAFPGGNCDKEDSLQGYEDQFKVTATREAFEELGMLVGDNPNKPIVEFSYENLPDPKLLNPFIRLITIPSLPRRYDTRYYIAFKFGNGKGQFQDHENLIKNDAECVKYLWLTPLEALSLYYKSELQLAPPQFIILNILSSFKDGESLRSYLGTLKQQFAPYLLCFRNNLSTNSYPSVYYNTFDQDYPITEIIQQESEASPLNQELIQNNNAQVGWKNRVYFSNRTSIFFDDYEVDVQLPFESPFKLMVSYKEIIGRIGGQNQRTDTPKL